MRPFCPLGAVDPRQLCFPLLCRIRLSNSLAVRSLCSWCYGLDELRASTSAFMSVPKGLLDGFLKASFLKSLWYGSAMSHWRSSRCSPECYGGVSLTQLISSTRKAWSVSGCMEKHHQDRWVLQIISDGCVLSFVPLPPVTRKLVETPLPAALPNRKVLCTEVRSLLGNRALEELLPGKGGGCG